MPSFKEQKMNVEKMYRAKPTKESIKKEYDYLKTLTLNEQCDYLEAKINYIEKAYAVKRQYHREYTESE